LLSSKKNAAPILRKFHSDGFGKNVKDLMRSVRRAVAWILPAGAAKHCKIMRPCPRQASEKKDILLANAEMDAG
jgi:hypothetical protein